MSKMEQELAHIKNLEEKAAEKNVGGGKTNNNKISVDAMTGSMEKSAEADRIDRQQKPLHLPINIPAVGSMAAGISPAGSTNKKVKPISEKLGGNTTLSLPVNALRRSTIPYLPQQQQQKTTTTKQLITRATITINATPPTTTATSIAPSSTTSLSRKNNAKEESAKQREDKVRQMNDQLLSALLSGGEKQITLHTGISLALSYYLSADSPLFDPSKKCVIQMLASGAIGLTGALVFAGNRCETGRANTAKTCPPRVVKGGLIKRARAPPSLAMMTMMMHSARSQNDLLPRGSLLLLQLQIRQRSKKSSRGKRALLLRQSRNFTLWRQNEGPNIALLLNRDPFRWHTQWLLLPPINHF